MYSIEDVFPDMPEDSYQITSSKDKTYNSFAWAIEINSCWIEPDVFEIYYWPSNIPLEATLEAFTTFYCSYGYEICDNEALESGFQKVAIYVDSHGNPTHAARQLETGKWASKIFDIEDIVHNSLKDLEGEVLGHAVRFLKKPQA